MTIDVRSELAVCSRELPLLAAHHRERANRCPLRSLRKHHSDLEVPERLKALQGRRAAVGSQPRRQQVSL